MSKQPLFERVAERLSVVDARHGRWLDGDASRLVDEIFHAERRAARWKAVAKGWRKTALALAPRVDALERQYERLKRADALIREYASADRTGDSDPARYGRAYRALIAYAERREP